jgi:hypothetical protein
LLSSLFFWYFGYLVVGPRAHFVGYYGSLTIKKGGRLYAPKWDGEKGGCLVIVARDVIIEEGGVIDASFCGYRGGAVNCQGESWTGKGKNSRAANGGGGGGTRDLEFSGAGGSFGNKGQRDHRCNESNDSCIGVVGDTYDPFSQLPRTLLGSGGGGNSEHSGGPGGGAVIIRTHSLVYSGTIMSLGEGRSGSGGLVLIVAEHVLGNGRLLAYSINRTGGAGHVIIRSPDARHEMNCDPAARKENNLEFPDLSGLIL